MGNPLERYLQGASGLTTITVQTAERLVQRLVRDGEVAADRVERMVSDLLEASQRNRQTVVEQVRHEVDRAVDRLGLVRRSELDDLERRLMTAVHAPSSTEAPSTTPQAGAAPPGAITAPTGQETAAARRAATARKTTAKTASKKAAAQKAVTKKAVTKKATAKRGSPTRTRTT